MFRGAILSRGASPPIDIDEPHSIEPRHASTRVELTGDELVIVMATLIELATGAARIERHEQVVPITLEDRHGGLGLR